jgi:hypothetical protein
MGTIYLSLPEVLHEQIKALAGKYKVSVDSLVTSVLAEKILALHAVENPTVRSRKTDASQAKNTLPKMAMHRVR